jgi:hypothetical protein
MTPYPQQTTSVFTPYGVESGPSGVTSYSSTSVSAPKASYGSSSNVHGTHLSGTQKISKALDDVGSWFKKKFARKGEFAVYDDKADRPEQHHTDAFVPGYDPYSSPHPHGSPEADRSHLSGSSFSDPFGHGSAGQGGRRDAGRGLSHAKKPTALLSPAKKLMKVTGGRALATAAELTTFKDSFTVESIEELSIGLEDPEWKVRTRAILGLEIIAEQYGLPAVARVKNRILGLNGAPQASLRTAANRFYAAIKDVVPLDAAAAISAFSFLDGHDGDVEEDKEEGQKLQEDRVDDAVPVPEEEVLSQDEEEAIEVVREDVCVEEKIEGDKDEEEEGKEETTEGGREDGDDE